MEIEAICAVVHEAYCDERVRQGKSPYWTDATKEYDRVTVKAVLECIEFDKLQVEVYNLKKVLEEIRTQIKHGDHMVGHVYSAHPLSKHVGGDLDRAFVHFGSIKSMIKYALEGKRYHKNIDEIIDQFVEDLDFDNIIAWANYLKIAKVDYPPIDDMYPDWEDELRVEVGDIVRNISKKEG